jgi:alpha-methylacyl-CoA racemase
MASEASWVPSFQPASSAQFPTTLTETDSPDPIEKVWRKGEITGPLSDVKVIEIAGIGPAPFAAMMLADMGAEVLRVDRPLAEGVGKDPELPLDHLLARGRRSIAVDLKHPDGTQLLLRLVESADALIEGFRPGVAERLGIHPEVCLTRNPKLVYGRMTGWGQEGPYARAAGHDINYIALAGVLKSIGRAGEPPVPPLNLVGDFGGGGMLLAFGVVCGLLEAGRSGLGQVIDAAMVDGAALLATMFYGLRARGAWSDERGTNFCDAGAHFYNVYETADRKYISVGAIEPHFYAALLRCIGLEGEELAPQMDRSQWPAMIERFAALFKMKTRDEWCAILEEGDTCFAPVLSMAEAPQHPHNKERETFVEISGVVQPAPAPRFSRTRNMIPRPPAYPGQHTDEALREWGFSELEIAKLRRTGAIA